MLIVIKTELITVKDMNTILAKREITITGQAISLYPEDEYIKEIEEKARKYDELIALGELVAKSMDHLDIDENRKIAKELKSKSLKLLEEFDDLLIEVRKN